MDNFRKIGYDIAILRYYNLNIVDIHTMYYNLKLELSILIHLVYLAELLSDFSHTNFTVSYTDALDRLRVQLNIILYLQVTCIMLT